MNFEFGPSQAQDDGILFFVFCLFVLALLRKAVV